jgi:hypothetical protein
MRYSDFRLSEWLIIGANSIHGLFHREYVVDFAEVSQVYAASIFSIDVCMLVSFCVYRAIYTHVCVYIYNSVLKATENGGYRVGIGASSVPVVTVDWDNCVDGPLRAQERIK